MDFDGVFADPNPQLPDPPPDADPSQVDQISSLTLEDAGDAASDEPTAGNESPPTNFHSERNPDFGNTNRDADPSPAEQMSSLTSENPGDAAGCERPAGNGSLHANFYVGSNSHHPDPKPEAPSRVEQISSLTLDSSDAAGAKRSASNGPLPSDFYLAADEIEIVEEVSPVAGDTAGISALGGHGAWREGSELDGEAPPSPSSSGYAGERGSSGASSGIEEVDGPGTLPDDWSRGKRHFDEDDGSLSWRKRKKHYFILSHSGKPIFSRYGDEHRLAGFSATLQAIISFVESSGDHIKYIRAGNHQVVFLVKGPIYLVCISCTEESYDTLKRQVELIYGQMLLILTKSVNRCFERNPKFDMTPLLKGTDAVFSSLIHAFSWNPATFLHAYTCLPLTYATRQAAGAILQDVADSGVLFALLMCKHKVVSLVGAQKASLHPDDMLLLSNFIMASESFRTSESFSPICLPRYNPMVFLYAYVHFLDVMDTYLVLLSTASDSFYHLKDCRIRIENVLVKSNVLSEVQRSMLDGGLHVEDVPLDSSRRSRSLPPQLAADNTIPEFSLSPAITGGPSGLWHFIYRSINLDQYVSSEFSSPISNPSQRKRLFRAYQRLYASMHDKGTGPHKTQFRRDEDFVLLCWITQDFELYAAFDPLAEKAQAIKTCNRVCQWVRDLENEIFLFGASPFSW
ncbi:protein SAND [Canna indica]|uniref:Vacuolar fusion protein MON1 homolog n=1 Tax=Canna indica TaxID=4628 RepID=A0AAQ3K4M2_9LILI|nr:protein SAND [Canna indica]